jgi:hypothetical protein
MEYETQNNSFGVVTGTSTALAFPSINSRQLRIKNHPAGVIGFIGAYGSATYPLASGDDTGWFEENNSGEIFYRGTGAYFSYWLQN